MWRHEWQCRSDQGEPLLASSQKMPSNISVCLKGFAAKARATELDHEHKVAPTARGAQRAQSCLHGARAAHPTTCLRTKTW